MVPIIDSGVTKSVPHLAASSRAPSHARACLYFQTAAPPSSSIMRIAAGAARCDDGSRVPGRSNSVVNPWSSPHEITAGCRFAWRSGDAHRMPLLRGTHIHLCRLATYQSRPSDGISSGIAPGACAPSASTRTPRARHAAAMSASGMTSALCDVMWSTIARRVRGPRAPTYASTSSPAERTG